MPKKAQTGAHPAGVRARTRIEIFDTTLRDGAQSEHIAYSQEDKLEIAHELDRLGVDYIECGWPGSNPKDRAFFKRLKKESFGHARITAFGSTRHVNRRAEDDPNLKALVESGAPVLTIFGKTWDYHVTHALRVTLEQNLEMIRSSVAFLKKHCQEVLYDAEHFFDGYRSHPDYALKTIDAAVEGGASAIVFCDTNGGTLTDDVARIVGEVRTRLGGLRLGIHPHNDSGVAVANALAAVKAGCVHVQGTINGFGERCGNVDLTSVVANLHLKLGYDCLSGETSVRRLSEVSHFIYEVGNLPPRDNQPYVGRSAFAHKGGIHVSAVNRSASTYEHIDPEKVGNSRRVLISELSGRSNLMAREGERLGLKGNPDALKKVLDRIMDLENQGYTFEAADASFEVLVRKTLNQHEPFFRFHRFKVTNQASEHGHAISEATVKVDVGGRVEHTAADGNGPVHALDRALRKALEPFYPELKEVSLADYKVRVVNPRAATGARVLVSIVSSDHKARWTTVGVSQNIVEASWHALVESIEYKLYQTRGSKKREGPKPAAKGGIAYVTGETTPRL
jgi:2-isopropylmalate synthase